MVIAMFGMGMFELLIVGLLALGGIAAVVVVITTLAGGRKRDRDA